MPGTSETGPRIRSTKVAAQPGDMKKSNRTNVVRALSFNVEGVMSEMTRQMSDEAQVRVLLERQLRLAESHLSRVNQTLGRKEAELAAAHVELRSRDDRMRVIEAEMEQARRSKEEVEATGVADHDNSDSSTTVAEEARAAAALETAVMAEAAKAEMEDMKRSTQELVRLAMSKLKDETATRERAESELSHALATLKDETATRERAESELSHALDENEKLYAQLDRLEQQQQQQQHQQQHAGAHDVTNRNSQNSGSVSRSRSSLESATDTSAGTGTDVETDDGETAGSAFRESNRNASLTEENNRLNGRVWQLEMTLKNLSRGFEAREGSLEAKLLERSKELVALRSQQSLCKDEMRGILTRMDCLVTVINDVGVEAAGALSQSPSPPLSQLTDEPPASQHTALLSSDAAAEPNLETGVDESAADMDVGPDRAVDLVDSDAAGSSARMLTEGTQESMRSEGGANAESHASSSQANASVVAPPTPVASPLPPSAGTSLTPLHEEEHEDYDEDEDEDDV